MSDSNLWRALQVSASGMSAERLRMTAVAENIANADSTTPLADGLPYQRQRVVVCGPFLMRRAGRVAVSTLALSPVRNTRRTTIPSIPMLIRKQVWSPAVILIRC